MRLTKGVIKREIRENFRGRFTNRDVYNHFERLLGRELTIEEKKRIAGILQYMAVKVTTKKVRRKEEIVRIVFYIL